MSGDRERGPLDFDDGPGEESARGAAPGRTTPTPAPAHAHSRGPGGGAPPYLWVVGAGAVALVLILLVTTLRHGTDRGARGVAVGEVMPAFAAPLALSRLDGDANIAQRAGEGEAGHEPACGVRGRDVLNGCALRAAGPVVLAFFVTRNRTCVRQLDALQRVAAQMPGVRFAAVAIRGDRDALRAMVRRHRWSFPVGYDRDGALANAYHVQVCPQITFARRGGRVVETTFGELTPAALAAKARRLAGGV